MSEPETVAEQVEQVIPGVWRWFVWDDRIDFESDAHAVADADGTVLIDPLPLKRAALRKLEPVAAICLTAACHQRSAWRYRKQFGSRVYAPEGSRPMEEEPDAYYGANEALPGGLKAIHTPGPEQAHFAFWRERAAGVVFCPDLIMRAEGGALEFVPPAYHEDPDATRDSVRRLLDLRFSVLCMDHGAPIKKDPQAELRKLLDKAA